MEFNQFIRSKRSTLIFFFVIFLILGILITFAQPFKYSAKSKILVIQEGASGVDPFAVSRSVEYLSSLFSQVVYSNSFFNLALNSDFNIEKDYFNGDSIKQMKIWKQTVSAKNVENSGFINISVFHSSPNQAKQIALAINQILMTQNMNYQGVGSSVKVVVIDEPLVSNYPVQPNLLINLGIIVGASLVFGFIYIYLFPEEKYNLSLFRSKRRVRPSENIKHNFLKPASQRERIYEADESEPQGNIRNILH